LTGEVFTTADVVWISRTGQAEIDGLRKGFFAREEEAV
jgi:hypothetical protein